MPAPICVSCELEMRCEKNDQFVNDVNAGPFPATYWSGDLFECPVCHAVIVITNQSFSDMSMRWSPRERDAWLKRYGDSPNGVLSITFAYSPEQREKYAGQFRNAEDTSKE